LPAVWKGEHQISPFPIRKVTIVVAEETIMLVKTGGLSVGCLVFQFRVSFLASNPCVFQHFQKVCFVRKLDRKCGHFREICFKDLKHKEKIGLQKSVTADGEKSLAS